MNKFIKMLHEEKHKQIGKVILKEKQEKIKPKKTPKKAKK
jgi:hypothetical protein